MLESLDCPLGGALIALAVVIADRYAPPWVRQLLGRIGAVKPPAATSPATLAGDTAGEPDREQLAELLGAATEAAAHRHPGLHPAEALERYVHGLRSMNHYYRDEAAKTLAAAKYDAASAAADAEAVIERYG